MTTKTTAGVTTTETTLRRVAEAAEAKGSTIPDLLLHEFLIAERAMDRAEEAKKRLTAAMKEYMTSEKVTELESAEARAVWFDVSNQSSFDTEGLKLAHPRLWKRFFKPGVGKHKAFKVTPKA